jgi:hypothetical protein
MRPGVRDETLTGLLAELLSDVSRNTVGEVRIRRKTPEVLLDLNGIRLILEGKAAGHRDDLYANACRRLDSGSCDAVVMVEYVALALEGSTPLPVDRQLIKQALKNGVFHVGFVTYGDRVGVRRWLPRRKKTPAFYEHVDFHHVVAHAMTTYEALVKDVNRDKVVGYLGLFATSHSLI